MFCPNCGANLPEDLVFCSECGTPLKKAQQPAPQSVPAAAQPAPAPARKKPAKAAIPAGKLPMITITMLISLLLIVFSVVSALNAPFYEIPAMSLLMTLADGEEDIDELLDSMDDTIDEMENDLEYQEDIMDDDEIEAAEMLIDGMKELQDNFSINNMKKLVDLTEEVGEEYMDDTDLSDIQEIAAAMDIVVIAIWVFFALPILFHLLGGLRKSAGLTITAMVFTTISQLILSGLLFVILSLAVGVFQVKLCKAQKAKVRRRPENVPVQ